MSSSQALFAPLKTTRGDLFNQDGVVQDSLRLTLSAKLALAAPIGAPLLGDGLRDAGIEHLQDEALLKRDAFWMRTRRQSRLTGLMLTRRAVSILIIYFLKIENRASI